jgi:hypothetical protein
MNQHLKILGQQFGLNRHQKHVSSKSSFARPILKLIFFFALNELFTAPQDGPECELGVQCFHISQDTKIVCKKERINKP